MASPPELEATMLIRPLLFAAVLFFTVTAINHSRAVWRGPPQTIAALDPETRDWVKGLTNKYGASGSHPRAPLGVGSHVRSRMSHMVPKLTQRWCSTSKEARAS